MPAALIPAALSVATSVAGGAGVATALIYGGINSVLSLALSSRSRQTSTTPSANPVGRKHILRSNEAPREIVYGRVRKSGLLTFAYSTGRAGNLHLVLTFAAHECKAIEKLWIDDEASTHNKYRNHAQFTAHTGGASQQADPHLVDAAPSWNASHRGENITYAHVTLRWDENLWYLGLPNITATIQGKKLYDPRIAETLLQNPTHPVENPNAYLFSDNPALCVLDYLIAPYGLECNPHEIDWQSFADAATLCEQLLEGDRRYRCNGVVTLDQSHIEVVEQLLTSCAGVLVYTQGKYRIFPASPKTPSAHLDASLLRADPKGLPKAERNQLFNSVRATLFDQQQGWIKSDIQPISNSQYTQDDGGKPLFYNLDFNFTTSKKHAQRLARLALEIVRPGARIHFPATLSALGIEVWDVVTVTLPQIGYLNKQCRVLAWKINENLGIDLELQEYDSNTYNFYQPTDQRPPDTTNLLPQPFFQQVNFQLKLITKNLLDEDNINDEGEQPSLLRATWVLPSKLIRSVSLQWKESHEQKWSGVNLPPETAQYDIAQAQTGKTYDCRIRMLNAIGITSPWQSLNNHLYTKQFQAPAVPRHFQVLEQNGTLKASWESDNALYLHGHLEIRYKKGADDAAWSDMQKVHSYPLRQRYSLLFPAPDTGRLLFAIRAYNRQNIPSAFAARASIVVDASATQSLPRDEAARAWQGGPESNGAVTENNHYRSRSQGGWSDLPATWRQLPATWKELFPLTNSLTYVTCIIDLGRVKAFQPLFQISAQGQFAITWRQSQVLPIPTPFAKIEDGGATTRFIQFLLTVTAQGNDKPNITEFVIDERS